MTSHHTRTQASHEPPKGKGKGKAKGKGEVMGTDGTSAGSWPTFQQYFSMLEYKKNQAWLMVQVAEVNLRESKAQFEFIRYKQEMLTKRGLAVLGDDPAQATSILVGDGPCSTKVGTRGNKVSSGVGQVSPPPGLAPPPLATTVESRDDPIHNWPRLYNP